MHNGADIDQTCYRSTLSKSHWVCISLPLAPPSTSDHQNWSIKGNRTTTCYGAIVGLAVQWQANRALISCVVGRASFGVSNLKSLDHGLDQMKQSSSQTRWHQCPANLAFTWTYPLTHSLPLSTKIVLFSRAVFCWSTILRNNVWPPERLVLYQASSKQTNSIHSFDTHTPLHEAPALRSFCCLSVQLGFWIRIGKKGQSTSSYHYMQEERDLCLNFWRWYVRIRDWPIQIIGSKQCDWNVSYLNPDRRVSG